MKLNRIAIQQKVKMWSGASCFPEVDYKTFDYAKKSIVESTGHLFNLRIAIINTIHNRSKPIFELI